MVSDNPGSAPRRIPDRAGFRVRFRRAARIPVFAAAVLLNSAAFGLDPARTLSQETHRVWAQQEGLLQPTVYSILQTRDGFLWLGTQDGLVRFDGVRFSEYNAGFLQGSIIRSLAEDAQGNLWVASLGRGLSRISRGVVRRYGPRDGIRGSNAFCVQPERNGVVWACTDSGLVRISGSAVRVFTTADGLTSNRVRSVCEAKDGTEWIAGHDFGLERFSGSRFEPYSDRILKPQQRISRLACAADGDVWAGGDGLYQISGSHTRRYGISSGLADDHVHAISQSADGAIWVGTDEGISRIRNGVVTIYRVRDGLSHSIVLSLYTDREGSLWAGTRNGLDQFTDSRVTPYRIDPNATEDNAGPVIEDHSGKLWIGTLGGGLAWFDGNRIRSLGAAKLIDNTILSLEIGPDGDLWVGTAKGVNRLHNGVVVGAWSRRDGLSGGAVRSLFFDDGGTLWAGTNRGIDRFDGVAFHAEPDAGAAGESSGVVALAGGRTVRLFAGLESNALELLINGRFSIRTPDIASPIDCYYLDHSEHTAWMGTLGSGLLRWKNGAISQIQVKDGLYDSRIYAVLRDDSSNLWFASSKGIFRIRLQELEDFAAGKSASIASIPFTTGQLHFQCQPGVQPAAWRSRDGRLWFSTSDGLVMIDPARLRANRVPPPVAITDVLMNGQPLDPGGPIDVNRADERNVEIRYAGLSFVSPERVRFRYRLEGFDSRWVDAGSRREAFFTNLPAGKYRFSVIANNADGVPASVPAVMQFTVEPEFYERAWFLLLAFAALGSLVLASYRLRVRRLRRNFEIVLAERSRIARELHDTLLQGLAGINMQMQALWTRLPGSNEKNVLSEIIGDARRCAREARESLWALRTRGDRPDFHEKLGNEARDAVKGRSIRLAAHIDPVSLVNTPDAEFALLRIAHEAIANAVAHSGATMLTIRSGVKDGAFLLVIEDNGIGFHFTRARSPGHFGLESMRERAAGIGATLTIESTPGEGTRITAALPVGRARLRVIRTHPVSEPTIP